MSLKEKIIIDVVQCRATGQLPKRLMITRSDLNALHKEIPDMIDSGLFYGLEITIIGEGGIAHVLPK